MEKQKLELRDFMDYAYLSQLAFSPDGAYASFVMQKAKPDADGYAGDLYVCDAAGEGVRRLTAAGD